MESSIQDNNVLRQNKTKCYVQTRPKYVIGSIILLYVFEASDTITTHIARMRP